MDNSDFLKFERLSRSSGLSLGKNPVELGEKEFFSDHPFDSRNIHGEISKACINLFNDGHFEEAVFKAFKIIEITVREKSGCKGQGYALMMDVFDEKKPRLKFNELKSNSEIDEQRGLRNIFAGAFPAVRNPRGHDDIPDTLDQCLDHLSFASYLMRHLDKAIRSI